jgi:hypothetical protein
VPSHSTTRLFAETFGVATIGAWKDHVTKSVPPSTRQNQNSRGSVPNKPDLKLSKELYDMLVALEDFWDVRGHFISS